MLPDYKQHTQRWILSLPLDFCAHPFSTQIFSFLNKVPQVLDYSAGEAALSMLCNCRLSGKHCSHLGKRLGKWKGAGSPSESLYTDWLCCCKFSYTPFQSTPPHTHTFTGSYSSLPMLALFPCCVQFDNAVGERMEM